MWLIYENIYGNVFKFKRSLLYIQVNQNLFFSPVATISQNPLYYHFCKQLFYMIVTNKSVFSPRKSLFVFSLLCSRGYIRLPFRTISQSKLNEFCFLHILISLQGCLIFESKKVSIFKYILILNESIWCTQYSKICLDTFSLYKYCYVSAKISKGFQPRQQPREV